MQRFNAQQVWQKLISQGGCVYCLSGEAIPPFLKVKGVQGEYTLQKVDLLICLTVELSPMGDRHSKWRLISRNKADQQSLIVMKDEYQLESAKVFMMQTEK